MYATTTGMPAGVLLLGPCTSFRADEVRHANVIIRRAGAASTLIPCSTVPAAPPSAVVPVYDVYIKEKQGGGMCGVRCDVGAWNLHDSGDSDPRSNFGGGRGLTTRAGA